MLEIDSENVTRMTRIECVKCLKDSNGATINLLVRKGETPVIQKKRAKPPPPPPQVPPRKINRKPTNGDISQKPTHISTTTVQVAETPVVAEMYVNILDDELHLRDNESDDTGSTISTVISNFSSETDLSNLFTPSATDLAKMLTKPFQLIEREFSASSPKALRKAEVLRYVFGFYVNLMQIGFKCNLVFRIGFWTKFRFLVWIEIICLTILLF